MKLSHDYPLSANDVDQRRTGFQKLQGYTIVNHGKKRVWLGLLNFNAADTGAIRTFLKAFGSQASTAWDMYSTFHQYQKLRAEEPAAVAAFKENYKAGVITALGLTARGHEALSIELPEDESWKACKNGFASTYNRRYAQLHNLTPLSGNYDAVLVLAGDDKSSMKIALGRLMKFLPPGANLKWEYGKGVKTGGFWREHFGYADGLSQPQIFAAGPPNPATPQTGYSDFAPLTMFLYCQPGTTDADEEYGSFMAYMKISQNVSDFEGLVDHTVKHCGQKTTPDNVRSWIVGRGLHGIPIGLTRANDNTFLYDAASQCPVSAHIRKANRRHNEERFTRILRRGVPYEQGDERGLLFQSFQVKIKEQFEEILYSWLLDPKFPEGGVGEDPILGTRPCPPLPASITMGTNPDVQRVTSILDGAYFYFPSIPFFNRL